MEEREPFLRAVSPSWPGRCWRWRPAGRGGERCERCKIKGRGKKVAAGTRVLVRSIRPRLATPRRLRDRANLFFLLGNHDVKGVDRRLVTDHQQESAIVLNVGAQQRRGFSLHLTNV